jgi:hypothetical protein
VRIRRDRRHLATNPGVVAGVAWRSHVATRYALFSVHRRGGPMAKKKGKKKGRKK